MAAGETPTAYRWRLGFWGAVAAVVLGVLFLVSNLGNGLRWLSYDVPYLFTRPAPCDEIVIVTLDEESAKELGQDPTQEWNRTNHANLIRILDAKGARAIVFDVLFDQESDDPQADRALADAIRECGKVVVAADLRKQRIMLGDDENASAQMEIEVRPIELILTNETRIGLVNLPEDSDGRIRRHFVRQRGQDLSRYVLKPLSWVVAELLDVAPPDPTRVRWINFYGGPGTFRTYRFAEVASQPDAVFRNKVVFVGKGRTITSQGPQHDVYPTPFTRWTGIPAAGVELQAFAFRNLLQKDWLTEFPVLVEFFLVIITGVVFGYGFTRVRPYLVGSVGLVAFLLIGGWEILMVRTWHVWFPWLIIGAVQIPVALFAGILVTTRRVYEEKQQLEETLHRLTDEQARSAMGESAEPASATSVATAPTVVGNPQQVGLRIPNYRLVRCLGRGAYGEVWLGEDLVGTYHAVKVVYRIRFGDSVPYEREFNGIRRFSPVSRDHPGLVQVLTIGRNDKEGYFYYVMELADDHKASWPLDPEEYVPHTLAAVLAERKYLPFEECLTLAIGLTEALDFLHQRGLLHRDIKPANIIFVKGRPKIADIGLVTEIMSAPGGVSLVGTPGYMPEEGAGTPSADLYSLGKVLYETLMGRNIREFPDLPSELDRRPDAPAVRAFHRVLMKACAQEPGRRYADAKELLHDLETLRIRCLTTDKNRQ